MSKQERNEMGHRAMPKMEEVQYALDLDEFTNAFLIKYQQHLYELNVDALIDLKILTKLK